MRPGRNPACSRYGTPLHMDGARLLEIAPWYGRDPAEIAALFDSVRRSFLPRLRLGLRVGRLTLSLTRAVPPSSAQVYLSFYKGLGGLSGAMLLATAPLVKRAIPWRRCVVVASLGAGASW